MNAPVVSRATGGTARLRTIQVFGFITCFNFLWVWFNGSLVFSAPVDTVEQLTWVRSLAWGYEKHPPLPTLLLWPMVQVFGQRPLAAYLLSALLVALALTLMWRLTREAFGVAFAWLALLGTLCSGWYSTHLIYYDHDVVLMTTFALAGWFCWRALRDRSLLAWAGVGVALGLGALTKYGVAITVIAVAASWLGEGGWRDPVHRRGALVAMLIAGTIFAPHVWWLFNNDFAPFHYAEQSTRDLHFGALRRVAHVLTFGYQQVRQLFVATGLAFILLWLARRRSRDGGGAGQAPTWQGSFGNDEALRGPDTTRMPPPDALNIAWFLFCWGALPLLTIMLIGLAFGIRLQYHWGEAFMPFTCAWVMRVIAIRRWQQIAPRQLVTAFFVTQALLLAAIWVGAPGGLGRGYGTYIQAFFPTQRLANELAPAAHAELCGPIRVIAGPWFEAAAIALALDDKPLVLIDGDPKRSPWVTRSVLEHSPILWIGHPSVPIPGEPPAAARHHLQNQYWWAIAAGPHSAPECLPGPGVAQSRRVKTSQGLAR